MRRGSGEERGGAHVAASIGEPWPPPRGRAEVLDRLLDLTEAIAAGDDARMVALLAPDVVVSAPPLDPSRAFRHHFGVAGVLDAARAWRRLPEAAVIRPERFLAEGRRAVVVAELRWPEQPVVPVAWLCRVRSDRLSELRAFRYPSDALLRFSVLDSGDDA